MNKGKDAAAEAGGQPLFVSGTLADQLQLIGRSDMSLATTFARTSDGEPVLLPLIDWQLSGGAASSEADQEKLIGLLLSVDNMAFLLHSLADEMNDSLSALLNLVRGGQVKCSLDIANTREWLRSAAQSAEAAAALLDQVEASDAPRSEGA